MKIAMMYWNNPPFLLNTHEKVGLGGSENCFINTVKGLIKLGHEVHVFNKYEGPTIDYGNRLKWSNENDFDQNEYFDVVFSLRHREPFQKLKMNTKLKVLFLADTESVGLSEDVRKGNIHLVMAVSNWQKEKIAKEESLHEDYWYVTSNGFDDSLPGTYDTEKIPGKCIFTATPERGLSNLIAMWPEIKQRVPHASLHLFSSTLGWGMDDATNQGMWGDLYNQVESMKHLDVVNHKHANALELRKELASSEFYLNPSNFYETCCMSILEAMGVGTIPIATGRAAILEKIVHAITGIIIPAYGAETERYRKMFVDSTCTLLLESSGIKRQFVTNCQRYATNYTYDILVEEWVNEWIRRIS